MREARIRLSQGSAPEQHPHRLQREEVVAGHLWLSVQFNQGWRDGLGYRGESQSHAQARRRLHVTFDLDTSSPKVALLPPLGPEATVALLALAKSPCRDQQEHMGARPPSPSQPQACPGLPSERAPLHPSQASLEAQSVKNLPAVQET